MAGKSNEKQPSLPPEEDAETLAAVRRGIRDADEGRVISMEAVRAKISQWTSKSSSQTKR